MGELKKIFEMSASMASLFGRGKKYNYQENSVHFIYCTINNYCTFILKKHMPVIPQKIIIIIIIIVL